MHCLLLEDNHFHMPTLCISGMDPTYYFIIKTFPVASLKLLLIYSFPSRFSSVKESHLKMCQMLIMIMLSGNRYYF